MQQLFDLFLKTGLRPFAFLTDTAQLEQKVTRSDMTTLLILSYRGDMAMSDLASEMGAPLSSMTSIAKRLERKGYIARGTSPQDQRVTLVTLTQQGRSLARQAQSFIENVIGRVQQVLTPEELEQFITLALKVAKVLQDDRSPNPSQDVKSKASRNIPIEE